MAKPSSKAGQPREDPLANTPTFKQRRGHRPPHQPRAQGNSLVGHAELPKVAFFAVLGIESTVFHGTMPSKLVPLEENVSSNYFMARQSAPAGHSGFF